MTELQPGQFAPELLKHLERVTKELEEATDYVSENCTPKGMTNHNAGVWNCAVKEAKEIIAKAKRK